MCKSKLMAIKRDTSKAYDQVEWKFLEALMLKLGFAENGLNGWCYVYLQLHIKSSLMRGQWTLSHHGAFIRATDFPVLVHYLYIGTYISPKMSRRGRSNWWPQDRTSQSSMSHILFTDDSLFFYRSDLLQSAKKLLEHTRKLRWKS